jgi:hypothetical protein
MDPVAWPSTQRCACGRFPHRLSHLHQFAFKLRHLQHNLVRGPRRSCVFAKFESSVFTHCICLQILQVPLPRSSSAESYQTVSSVSHFKLQSKSYIFYTANVCTVTRCIAFLKSNCVPGLHQFCPPGIQLAPPHFPWSRRPEGTAHRLAGTPCLVPGASRSGSIGADSRTHRSTAPRGTCA